VAPRGNGRGCRGAKPKSSASFKEDRSNYPSAKISRQFRGQDFHCNRDEARKARAGNREVRITSHVEEEAMIRKLKSGQYRLYSPKKDAKTGRRRNLGTFSPRNAAVLHEREVQYFKRH
jgi:hypothetical protein